MADGNFLVQVCEVVGFFFSCISIIIEFILIRITFAEQCPWLEVMLILERTFSL